VIVLQAADVQPPESAPLFASTYRFATVRFVVVKVSPTPVVEKMF
jgi:hypothetical protein